MSRPKSAGPNKASRPKTRRGTAVALKYVPSLPAPFLSAKASGRAATRLVEIARQAGVPVLVEEGLANALFPLDIGDFVPEEYFEVVAKAFAFVKSIEERY